MKKIVGMICICLTLACLTACGQTSAAQRHWSAASKDGKLENYVKENIDKIDMEALQDMAREKRIKGILLDVLNSEPPLPDDLKIIENDNVLLTPHICGATYEVTDHQSDIITER